MLGGALPRLSRVSREEGEISSSSRASCEVTGISTWGGGQPDPALNSMTVTVARGARSGLAAVFGRLPRLREPCLALAPPRRDLGGRGDPCAAAGDVVERRDVARPPAGEELLGGGVRMPEQHRETAHGLHALEVLAHLRDGAGRIQLHGAKER